jgi:hypothetical protein
MAEYYSSNPLKSNDGRLEMMLDIVRGGCQYDIMPDTSQRPGQQRRALGDHPNSLAASDDPVTKKKIAEGRHRYLLDHAAMEDWARGGFSSGFSSREDEATYPEQVTEGGS